MTPPADDRATESLEQHRELFARALAGSARELEGKVEELGVLRQMGRLFERSTRLDDLASHALPILLQLSAARNASIMVLPKGAEELTLLAALGRDEGRVAFFGLGGYPHRLFRIGEGLAGCCLAGGEPLEAEEAARDERFIPGFGKVGVGSLICIPLMVRDEPLGVVNLSHPEPRALVGRRLPILATLSSYLAVALSQALLFDELRASNRRLEERVRGRTRTLERTVRELEQARAELATHSEGLEEKVRDRTRELEAALGQVRDQNIRLEEANRIKDDFLNNINHELKTPLNAIIGYAGLLLRETAATLGAEQRADLELIEANGKHLQQILENIFSLKDIESGELELARVPSDLSEVIRSVAASLRPRAHEKGLGLQVEAEEGPPVPLDPTLIRRVLFNLLDNAVKFSYEGDVTIRRRDAFRHPERPQEDCPPERGGVRCAVVEVEDRGKGIQAEDVDRIFQKFQQAEVPTRKSEGGSGLGLTIAKNLVELHGGRIWVTSRPGRGSTFGFNLPHDA
jgi:signal transduction histidine kinase